MNIIKSKKKNVILIGILLILINVAVSNQVFASFAEYDDKTADEQTNKQLQEQEEIDRQNIGKSSNNYLAQLEVEGYKITPEFDKQTINYTIDNEIDVKTITINAAAEDDRATINGAGTINIEQGEENITVNVIAENGIQRSYFIKINTPKAEETDNVDDVENNVNTEQVETEIQKEENVFTKNKMLIIVGITAIVIVGGIIVIKKK